MTFSIQASCLLFLSFSANGEAKKHKLEDWSWVRVVTAAPTENHEMSVNIQEAKRVLHERVFWVILGLYTMALIFCSYFWRYLWGRSRRPSVVQVEQHHHHHHYHDNTVSYTSGSTTAAVSKPTLHPSAPLVVPMSIDYGSFPVEITNRMEAIAPPAQNPNHYRSEGTHRV